MTNHKKVEIRFSKNKSELDEAYELAAKVFGPNYFDAKDIKKQIQIIDPVEDFLDAILVIANGQVVGFLRIVNREVWLGKDILKVGGITSVCLHPEFRGKGYGQDIMQMAISRLFERKDCLAITFARHAVDGFYSKFGFVGLGCHPEMTVTLEPRHYSLNNSLTLQAGLNNRFLNFYASAYENTYRPLVMSFVRNSRWWENASSLLTDRIDPEGFVTVIENQQPIGYFISHKGKIIEAASVNKSQNTLISGLIKYFSQKETELSFSLPVSHWLIKSLRKMNHTLKVRYSWDGGHMLRLLNSSPFVNAISQRGDLLPTVILEKTKRMDTTHNENAHQIAMEFGQAFNLPAWSFIDEF